ncbi:Retinol dehydrogenase 8 [Trichoplax sp. H2]|uniref:Retinol dehydrogenase n=1 Tax=Trichoplax adhaerens TaxID=10228 RepID=B3RJ90_TRIAD|nr:hypothetical protein TRIADDRAFT_51451 [Trichoplax adhaerens]EDV29287.1 hypothetical protein TRIADDRAFT_51451 [Trichoplax adhaerens]RDD38277.1 Retinol dehydrogenase 8 [Trichoplax sp. H2]|eukprot:XP_002108489.1 hypothetical protein TRIADDRAFT_51451 [Trichoplax adhaerens]
MPKIVLITGCTTGFGLALAIRLGKDEAKRYLVYATLPFLHEKDALVAQAGEAVDDTIFIRHLDVTKENTIESVVVEIIQTHGSIDVLVNNAGIPLTAPVETLSLADHKQVMDINFWGTFLTIRYVLPHMKKQRSGRIINMASIAGVLSVPYDPLYCASKFAVESLSLSLAVELQAFNVAVSIISPSVAATNMSKRAVSIAKELGVMESGMDDRTKQLYTTYTTMWQHDESAFQPVDEVIEVIIKAMTDEKPIFRYLTSTAAENLAKVKLIDTTGNAEIEGVNELTKNLFISAANS